jgi:archaellum component FlaF (FlaF/FlaG flagellin family)
VKLIAPIFVILFANPSYAWNVFEAQTYDQCILENMKDVSSDDAARQIAMACMRKYSSAKSKRECQMRGMTAEENKRVSVKFYDIDNVSQNFTVTIYNGNEFASIDEVTILVSAENINPSQEYRLLLPHSVNSKSTVKASVVIQEVPWRDFSWAVESIKTCSPASGRDVATSREVDYRQKMKTYLVTVDNVEYEIDAPDERTAWYIANMNHRYRK